MTSTLPWDLGEEFTLAVGVAEQSWTDPVQRLPISAADEPLYRFENNTWVRLGSFQRTSNGKTYQLIPPTTPTLTAAPNVQFWNLIDLQGSNLPLTSLEAGQALPFTVQWRATSPITIDLTTFAHLLDNQGQVVAQLDWTPQDALGYLPTTAWHPERSVIDTQAISLPEHLTPGQYQLVIGWYYAITGERLPLTAGEGVDTAQLGVVTVW